MIELTSKLYVIVFSDVLCWFSRYNKKSKVMGQKEILKAVRRNLKPHVLSVYSGVT